MAGSALSRLWNTHPRLAFGLHLGGCILFAILTVQSLVRRYERDIDAILAVGLLFMTGSLVFFTREAIGRGWSRSDW